jgi:hypothetical protein
MKLIMKNVKRLEMHRPQLKSKSSRRRLSKCQQNVKCRVIYKESPKIATRSRLRTELTPRKN